MARVNLCANPSFAYLLRGWSKILPASIRVGSDPAPWGGHARQSPQYLAVDIPAGAEGPIARSRSRTARFLRRVRSCAPARAWPSRSPPSGR